MKSNPKLQKSSKENNQHYSVSHFDYLPNKDKNKEEIAVGGRGRETVVLRRMNKPKRGGSGNSSSNTARQKQSQEIDPQEVISSEDLMSNDNILLSTTHRQQSQFNNPAKVPILLQFSQSPQSISPHYISSLNSPFTSQTHFLDENMLSKQNNQQFDTGNQDKPAKNILTIGNTPKHNITIGQQIFSEEKPQIPLNLTQIDSPNEDKAISFPITSNNNLIDQGFSKWNIPSAETEQNAFGTYSTRNLYDRTENNNSNINLANQTTNKNEVNQVNTFNRSKSKIMTAAMRNRLKNKQNLAKTSENNLDKEKEVPTYRADEENYFISQDTTNRNNQQETNRPSLFNMTESIRINTNNNTTNAPPVSPFIHTTSFKISGSNPKQILQTKGSAGSNHSQNNNLNSNARIYPESRQMLTRGKQASVFSQQSLHTRPEDENTNNLFIPHSMQDSRRISNGNVNSNTENNITLQIPMRLAANGGGTQSQNNTPQSQNNTPQSIQNTQMKMKSQVEITRGTSFSPQKISSKQVIDQQRPATKSSALNKLCGFVTRHFLKKSTIHSIHPQTSHSPINNNNNLINQMSNSQLTQDKQGPQLTLQASQNLMGSSSIGNLPLTNAEINPGTNWNFVKKLAKVKKFIDSIKTSNLYQSFYKVKPTHLYLIADKADYSMSLIDGSDSQSSTSRITSTGMKLVNPALTVMGRFFWNLWSYLEEKISQIPAFLPHQPLLNMFKIAMLLVSVVTLVIAPLVGCFDLTIEQTSAEHYLFFVVPCVLFSIEIIISLNTAYYEEGDVQTNKIKILMQYVKTVLFIDVASVVSLYLLMVTGSPIFVLFVMLKIFKIPAYRRDINEYFYIQQRANTLYTLVNLILSVLIVAHYIACGFNYIAAVEENDYHVSSWVTQLNLDATSWVSRYINAIYFSFITMVTVGFGDIKPMTDPEKIYVTLVALSSSLIFAYTVNTIGTVFQEIAQQEAEYKSQKYHLSVYMRSRSINQRLQTRAMKYLDHMIHKQLESPQKGQEILKKMPNKVRDEIYKDFFGKILHDSKMFKFNFSEPFLKELTVFMKEIICRPGEIVFSFNETDNRIFFINKGEVELFLEKNKKKDEQDTYSYDVLSKGDIFGEQSFFTSKIRETSAKSLSVSHLVYCTYEDFVQVLKQFPKDYMKDEVMNYKEQLSTRCPACSKFRHSIVNCPYVHLIRRPENVIHRHIRSIPNERSKHFRSKQNKENALEINLKARATLRKLRREYVIKASKKLKEENNDDNANSNSNKNGQYQINVKGMHDSDDELVETETAEDMRKLPDRKFLRSMPKIDLEISVNSGGLINQEEQQMMEEIEEDEYLIEEEEEEEDQVIEDGYEEGQKDEEEEEMEGDEEEEREGENDDQEEEDQEEGLQYQDESDEEDGKVEGGDVSKTTTLIPIHQINLEDNENTQFRSDQYNTHIPKKIISTNGLSIVISQVEDVDNRNLNNIDSNEEMKPSQLGLPSQMVIAENTNSKQVELEQEQRSEGANNQLISNIIDGNQQENEDEEGFLDEVTQEKSQNNNRISSLKHITPPIQNTDRTHVPSQVNTDSTSLKKLKSLDEKFDQEFIKNNLQNINKYPHSKQKLSHSADSLSSFQDPQSLSVLTEKLQHHSNKPTMIDSKESLTLLTQGAKTDNTLNYKQKNRLVFKNSVFSLKLANLATNVKFKEKQLISVDNSSEESLDLDHPSIMELKSANTSFREKRKHDPSKNSNTSIKSIQMPTFQAIQSHRRINHSVDTNKIDPMVVSSPLAFVKHEFSPEHKKSLSKIKQKTNSSKQKSEHFITISKQLQQSQKFEEQDKQSEKSSRSISAGGTEKKKFLNTQSLERKKIKVAPINIAAILDAGDIPSPGVITNVPQKKLVLKYSTPMHSAKNILETTGELESQQVPQNRQRGDKKNRLRSMMIPSSSQNEPISNNNPTIGKQIGVDSPFSTNTTTLHLQVPNPEIPNSINNLDIEKRQIGKRKQTNKLENNPANNNTLALSGPRFDNLQPQSQLGNAGNRQSKLFSNLTGQNQQSAFKKMSLLNPHHDFSTAWSTNQLSVPLNSSTNINIGDILPSQQQQPQQQMHLLTVPMSNSQGFCQFIENTNNNNNTLKSNISPMPSPVVIAPLNLSAINTPGSTMRSLKKQSTMVHHPQSLFFPGNNNNNNNKGMMFPSSPVPSSLKSPNTMISNNSIGNNNIINSQMSNNKNNMTFNNNNNNLNNFNILNNTNNTNNSNNFVNNNGSQQMSQQQLLNNNIQIGGQQSQQQITSQSLMQSPQIQSQQQFQLLTQYQLQQQQQQLLQSIQLLTQNQHLGQLSAPQHLHNLLGNPNNNNNTEANIVNTNSNTNNLLAEEAYVAEYRSHKMLFLYDFDRLKEFTNYFPHNNYSIVCKEKKKIVIRKNLFAAKRFMGSSARGALFKQSFNILPASHPSPRGNVHPSLLMSANLNNQNNMNHSFNGSFRGAVSQGNKMFSTVMQASQNLGHLNLHLPGGDTPMDLPGLDRQRSKLKKAADSLLTSKVESQKSFKRIVRSDQVSTVNNINMADLQGNNSNSNQNKLNPAGNNNNNNNFNGGNSRISSFANICNTYTEIQDISPSSQQQAKVIKSSDALQEAENTGGFPSMNKRNSNSNENVFHFNETQGKNEALEQPLSFMEQFASIKMGESTKQLGNPNKLS